jgi:hypothetical protein
VAYSIIDFARSVSPDKCKIQNWPDLIFLCGGIIKSDGPFRSARDFFYRYLQSTKSPWAERTKLAEEISAWFQKDDAKAFPDLLQLENYLAGLAAATVLFVESPGSIAELGAFAASDQLRPKTVAIINNFYGRAPSFIADGPIRRIKEENENHVLYYDWNPDELNSAETKEEFEIIAAALISSLEKEDAERGKQLSFQPKEISHALLLVADLIRIPGVATKSDLKACLEAFGCDSARVILDRYLAILQSVGFIEKRFRSNETFYVSVSSAGFVRYAFGEDALTDAQRIQTEIRNSLDSNRRAILRRILEKRGSNA